MPMVTIVVCVFLGVVGFLYLVFFAMIYALTHEDRCEKYKDRPAGFCGTLARCISDFFICLFYEAPAAIIDMVNNTTPDMHPGESPGIRHIRYELEDQRKQLEEMKKKFEELEKDNG